MNEAKPLSYFPFQSPTLDATGQVSSESPEFPCTQSAMRGGGSPELSVRAPCAKKAHDWRARLEPGGASGPLDPETRGPVGAFPTGETVGFRLTGKAQVT